jgi:uncharacterized protein
MKKDTVTRRLENLIFGARIWIIAFFSVLTVLMAWSATHLRIDAGFGKLLPLKHEYMQTFVEYEREFGGANRILIALMAKDGDIFTQEFFETLEQATDAVFFIPGVDRAQVSSIFTPNVRFTEVVEDGISGGNVVPADFQPTAEVLSRFARIFSRQGFLDDWSPAISPGRSSAHSFSTSTPIRENALTILPWGDFSRTRFAILSKATP